MLRRTIRKLYSNINSLTKPRTTRCLQSLTHLILKKNSIAELTSNVFTPLHKLKVLDLSHNKISSVSSGAFHGLTNLERLVLRSNALRHIPSDSFTYISTLRALDLGSNALSMVEESAFYHLNQLEELLLDQCALSQIHADAFVGVASLKKLNVQNNNLLVFPRAISRLTELEDLNVGGNLMPKISTNDLKHLRKLKRLHLTRSENLERIEEDVFRHTPELEELWMEFNMQLEHLPSTLLNHLRQLRKVSLRGNDLKYIHPELLPVDQLESFDVTKNPLVCNCSLTWLWRHMAQKPHAYHNSSAVRCHGPPHLHMDFLKSLSDVQLNCEGESGRGILAVTFTSLAVFVLVSVVLFLTWRRRISDARTGTIIKDLDTSPVKYASYDNHKYPYIIQPHAYTTLQAHHPIAQALSVGPGNGLPLEPSYATLNPNALQSYLMSLNGALPVDTGNRAYQILSCHTISSRTPSDPGYETIGRFSDQCLSQQSQRLLHHQLQGQQTLQQQQQEGQLPKHQSQPSTYHSLIYV